MVKGPLSQQQNEDAGQPDSHGAWFTPEQVTELEPSYNYAAFVY